MLPPQIVLPQQVMLPQQVVLLQKVVLPKQVILPMDLVGAEAVIILLPPPHMPSYLTSTTTHA